MSAPVPLRSHSFQLHNYNSATLLDHSLTHTLFYIETTSDNNTVLRSLIEAV